MLVAPFKDLLRSPSREVFKAKHRQTGKKVALKKVLMENEKEGVRNVDLIGHVLLCGVSSVQTVLGGQVCEPQCCSVAACECQTLERRRYCLLSKDASSFGKNPLYRWVRKFHC